jgi:hypothetical protein
MRYSFVALLLLLLSSAGLAQTTVPFAFAAGTTAKASEVNADFQALATAIDNLASRVSKLEGTLSVGDVAGTYNIVAMGLEVNAPSTTNSSVIHATSSGNVTLDANGTFSWSQSLTDAKLSISLGAPGSTAATTFSSTETHSGTWSLSGKILTLSFLGGLAQPFFDAAGSSLFITTNVDFSGGDLRHTLFFLVRAN